MPIVMTKSEREKLREAESTVSSSPGSTSHRSSIPDETFDMCCIETPELTLGLDFIADVLSEADHSSKPIPKKLGVEIVESIVRWAWSQESYKRWATTKENAASVGLEMFQIYDYYAQTLHRGEKTKTSSEYRQFRQDLGEKFVDILWGSETSVVVTGLLTKLFQVREPIASRKDTEEFLGTDMVTTYETLASTNDTWRRQLLLPTHLQTHFGMDESPLKSGHKCDKKCCVMSKHEINETVQFLSKFLPKAQEKLVKERTALETKLEKIRTNLESLEPQQDAEFTAQSVMDTLWKKFTEKPGGYRALMTVMACSLQFREGKMSAEEVAAAYTKYCKCSEDTKVD